MYNYLSLEKEHSVKAQYHYDYTLRNCIGKNRCVCSHYKQLNIGPDAQFKKEKKVGSFQRLENKGRGFSRY